MVASTEGVLTKVSPCDEDPRDSRGAEDEREADTGTKVRRAAELLAFARTSGVIYKILTSRLPVVGLALQM